MGNWNTPNNSEPAHENVLKALADKDTYSLTMGQAGGAWMNLPVGSMLWNNSAGYFQRWNGSNAIPVVISVAGGGTGASNAAQARVNLGANDAGNLTTGTLPTARLSGTYSISINGSAATATNATNAANAADSALLQGNNAAFYRNASNLNAGTVPAARLPLNNTVTSTSTTQAATANAVKTAHDRASTQVGGGSVSGVYYNSLTKNADGDFNFGQFSISRIGNTVTVTVTSLLSTQNTNNSSATSIGFLPSWARPSGQVSVFSGYARSEYITEFRVRSNGEIVLFAVGANFDLVSSRSGGNWAGPNTISYNV